MPPHPRRERLRPPEPSCRPRNSGGVPGASAGHRLPVARRPNPAVRSRRSACLTGPLRGVVRRPAELVRDDAVLARGNEIPGSSRSLRHCDQVIERGDSDADAEERRLDSVLTEGLVLRCAGRVAEDVEGAELRVEGSARRARPRLQRPGPAASCFVRPARVDSGFVLTSNNRTGHNQLQIARCRECRTQMSAGLG